MSCTEVPGDYCPVPGILGAGMCVGPDGRPGHVSCVFCHRPRKDEELPPRLQQARGCPNGG
jgi:hypothetical protein